MRPFSRRSWLVAGIAILAVGAALCPWGAVNVTEAPAKRPAPPKTPPARLEQKMPEARPPQPGWGTAATGGEEPAWLREAPVIFEELKPEPDGSGRAHRVRIRQVAMKHPLLRVVEQLAPDREVTARQAMVADHLMVQAAAGVNRETLERIAREHGADLRKVSTTGDYYLVSFPLAGGDALPGMMEALNNEAAINTAEPDWLQAALAVPNDPSFASQWALNNTAQVTGSTADADIDAPEAWNITQGGGSVVVGIMDTGMDLTHPDLAPNVWTNPGEIAANGIDDDGNGYIDDVNGWDFVNEDANPTDDHYHGTHCAGIIGARGNNALGISGVCWQVRLMPLKFLNTSGTGFTSDAVDAVNYARIKGAAVTSNSWGGGSYSSTLENAIKAARDAGGVFVAAAGNSATDNDLTPQYPACYAVDNVIAVAATDNRDVLVSFSSFGANSIHIAAPGSAIFSTLPQAVTSAMTSAALPAGYGSMSGSSMATPHVAGVCALLKAFRPSLTYTQIRNAVLSGGDRLTVLNGRVSTAARLNATRSLELLDDLTITPQGGLTSSGPSGGPFAPSSVAHTITNNGTTAANWSATSTQSWLTITPQTGVLAAGASTVVSVSLNPQANSLAATTQTGAVTFQNLDRGTSQTRLVTLTIEGVAPMPMTQNWEGGVMPSWWKNTGTGTWRNLLTSSYGPQGNYHLVLDSSASSTTNSVNQGTVSLNLTGYTGVRLRFSAKSLSDEPNGPPATPFTGSPAFDGVAISANGVSWYEIQPLRSLGASYQAFDLDLDAAAQNFGLAYNSTFKIRFSHADNSPAPEDGIALDDIQVTGTPPVGMSMTGPAQLREAVNATCAIKLSPAPTTAGTISLFSPNVDRLTFPTTVSYSAGSTQAIFTLTARDDALLNGSQDVTLYASATGYGSTSMALTVLDNETASMSLVLPSGVTEGSGVSVIGRVIASQAPARDIKVTLSSSLPAQIGVPVVVTIPAGQTEGSFPLIVTNDTRIESPQSVTITASVPNWPSASAAVVVTDDETFVLRLTLPAQMDRFAGMVPNAGTVNLTGTLASDLIVTLANSEPGDVDLPPQVVIPAGAQQAAFPITIFENSDPAAPASVTIGASAAGFTGGLGTISLVEATSRVWTLNQPSNDLLFDRDHERLLASVPGSAALVNGGLASITPANAALASLLPMNEEPGMLRSGGSVRNIWAATRNGRRLLHLNSSSLATLGTIDLGSDPVGGSYSATDFAVHPLFGDRVAVALRLSGTLPHLAGLSVYQGGPTPVSLLPTAGITTVEWADDFTLLGYDQETSQHAVRVFGDAPEGLIAGASSTSLLAAPQSDIRVSGAAYATTGEVFNAATLALQRTVSAHGPVCVFADIGRVCWLQQSGTNATLFIYDTAAAHLLGTVSVSGLAGTAESLTACDGSSRRAAFRTTGGQIFLVRSTLLETASTPRLSVYPASGANFTRYAANPVSPASAAFTLVNLGGTSITATASVNVPWLALSASSVNLAANAATDLVVTPNSAALSLPTGLHTALLTLNQGTNTTTRTITLDVQPANTPPTITSIAAQTSGGDVPLGPLAFTIGDAETAASSLVVTATSSNQALIPDWNLTTGGSGATRTITLAALPNRSGTAVITLTVADPGSSTSTSFNVTVNAVNDPPVISTISGSSCLEDQSVTGLAFTISDPETPSGDLVVNASSSNPALLPASRVFLGGSGGTRTLSLVPLPDQNGSTTVTVSVTDGQLTASRSFLFTVTAVNDAPTLDAPPNLAFAATPAMQTVNLTGISSGAANESQTLTISAVSSNPAIVPNPVVSYSSPAATGTLSLTPAAGATGTASITVTVNDNGGGTSTTIRRFDVTIGVPVISGFTPASGPAGTVVTINGQGFEPAPAGNLVSFGAVRGEVLSASSTQLTVLAPAGATRKALSVTSRGLTGHALRPFLLTFPNTRTLSTACFGPVQFLPKTIHPGFSERRVLTADLDADGRADVLAKGATGFEFTRNAITDGVVHPGAFDPLAQVDFTTTISGMMAWDYGDLDGDGRLDVVACGDAGVFIFRNAGPGIQFEPKSQLSSTLASTVLVSDLDGDGKPEILAAESPSVAVFRNTSGPAGIGFAPKVLLPASTIGASALMLEDMDGDGRRDLVAGITTGPQIYRATGVLPLGTASFASPVTYAVNVSTYGTRVTTADFDGDGKIDLAATGFPTSATSTTPGVVTFFRNAATPGVINAASMEARVELPAPPQPSNIEAADLDGDGRPDLVVTSYGATATSASVWLNANTSGSLTSGAFGSRVDLPGNIGGSLAGSMCGDLDGDGRPEIVIGSAGQRVQVWKNQFGLSQPQITALSPDSGPVGASVTISGSGFSTSTGGNVVYFGSRRATVLSASVSQLVVEVPAGTASDLVSVTVAGTSATSPLPFRTTLPATRLLTTASYSAGTVIGAGSVDTTSYLNPITIADVDGDGRKDVIQTRTIANAVLIYRNLSATGSTLGTAAFAAPLTLTTRELPVDNRLHDVDGDGKADLCVVSSTGAQLCVFRNQSTPGVLAFGTRQDFAVAGTPNFMEIADLNADARPDFILGDTAFSTGRYHTLLNTSSAGTIAFQAFTTTNAGGVASTALRQPLLRDFDGDGILDIGSASTSEFTSMRGGSSSWSTPLAHIWRGGNYLQSADFDGDGRPDVISHETSSSSTARLSLGRNIATPGTLGLTSFAWTFANWVVPSTTLPYLADLDGDARPDVVAAEGALNKLLIAQNFSTPGNAAAGPFVELVLTHNASAAAAGDLNGDGRADIAVSGSKSNVFTVFQNTMTDAGPVISTVPAQNVLEDHATGLLPVQISMEGVDPAAITLAASSSNSALTAALVLSGSGGTRYLQIIPQPDASGTATITLTASQGTLSGSTSFSYTVTAVNDAPQAAPLPPVIFMLAGTQLDLYLSGITPGPANESGQQLSFNAFSTDPALVQAIVTPLTGANDAVLSLTPAAGALGNATIAVTILDNGGTANDGQNSTWLPATVLVLDPYAFWKHETFGDDWQDPAVSGDNATPDGAPLPNLLRYAFNTTAVEAAEAAPALSTIEINGQRHAAFSHRRRLDDPSLNYLLECSADLVNWQPAGADFVLMGGVNNGDGTETVTLRSAQPLSSAACLMLRLKVTRTP